MTERMLSSDGMEMNLMTNLRSWLEIHFCCFQRSASQRTIRRGRDSGLAYSDRRYEWIEQPCYRKERRCDDSFILLLRAVICSIPFIQPDDLRVVRLDRALSSGL